MPLEPVEVDRLQQQLDGALAKRDYYHHEVVDPTAVVELEGQISELATKLRPDEPEEAIQEASRRVAFDRIGPRLVERSQLPRDPDYSEEAVRIRVRHLESEISNLAREANPERPQLVIRSATEDLILRSEGRSPRRFEVRSPAELPGDARQNLTAISRRLSRQAMGLQPTQLQKVVRIAADVGRLDQLQEEARRIAGVRSQRLFGGDVYELEKASRSVRSAGEILDESASAIYRRPKAALAAMERSLADRGEWQTAKALEIRPESFGELRGRNTLGLKENQDRARARSSARGTGAVLRGEAERRSTFDTELSFAYSDNELLSNNRRIVEALPSRESLLTELGRQMEGLELREVQSVLPMKQFEIVRNLRATEQAYLDPLRKAAKVAGSRSAAEAKAVSKILAPLFQGSPRHILRRLSPPQLRIGVTAVSMVRRVARTVVEARGSNF